MLDVGDIFTSRTLALPDYSASLDSFVQSANKTRNKEGYAKSIEACLKWPKEFYPSGFAHLICRWILDDCFPGTDLSLQLLTRVRHLNRV